MRTDVQLNELSDEMLSRLVRHALLDSDIHEVMPAGPGPAAWTPERLDEFVSFHKGRRGGLDGPASEVSWAILVDGTAAGVVRLQRVALGSLEVGMWLTRSTRGRGIGGQVLTSMMARATTLGANTLVAVTTSTNQAALSALARIGARIYAPTPDGRVRTEIELINPPGASNG
jgi:RimJ/RimL family protein N-acetyltransferase